MSIIRLLTVREASFEVDCRAWQDALLAQEAASRPPTVTGEPTLCVARGGETGTPGHRWAAQAGDTAYDLRDVLLNEAAFDVGDHGVWAEAREATHALWDTLNAWKVPYVAGLSGGVGTHTHVWFHNHEVSPDLSEMDEKETIKAWNSYWRRPRQAFVKFIMAAVDARLDIMTVLEGRGLRSDPVCHAPNYEARLMREFGGFKGTKRKTLWTVGPGPYQPLPTTREEAYIVTGLHIPKAITVAVTPPGVTHQRITEAMGYNCPRTVECFDPGALDLDATCPSCPIGA